MGSKTMKLIINILFEASPVLQEVETIPKFSFPFIGKKKEERKGRGRNKKKEESYNQRNYTHTHTHIQTEYI